MGINKKSFSLIEILVASVIFAIVLAGLAYLFVAGKYYITHSRSRMGGGEIGRHFLDPLQMHVRQDTWDSAGNRLSVGSWAGGAESLGLGGVTYSPEYTVSKVIVGGTDTELRKVKLKISWPEQNP